MTKYQTQPCEVTWELNEGVRICQDGTARPGVKVLDKRHTCADCLEEMVNEAIMRSGQPRKLVLLAFGIVGKQGRDQNSKVYRTLSGEAFKKKGVSQQELDRLKREAMRRGDDGGVEG